jgi:magnesium transporter
MLADRARRCSTWARCGSNHGASLIDQEDVARLISKYDLLAIPVIDDGGQVLGIVTVDDIIDALVKETTEDVQKFGGMEALDEPYMRIGLLTMIKKRAGWLCALFLGEMLTATAMGHFEAEISRAVVLALFIPLIISSGNSGSQATSLIIRAMALREVACATGGGGGPELPAGLTLGSILGVIGVVRILLWQRLGWYDYGAHYSLVALTVGTRTGGRRALRLACRVDAAVRAPPAGLRSRQRLGPVRRPS